MRAKFFIHIGMPKTGSTSIQHTMFENRATLLTWNINYLSLGRNHAGPLMGLLSDEPHKYTRNIRHRLDTPQKANLHSEVIRQRLIKALSNNRSTKLVISGEAFSTATPDEIYRLKELLEPFSSGYRIIVYVRDPYEFANSAALQRIKGGATFENSEGHIPFPKYRRIRTHIAAFGRDNVDIRIFDRDRFVGNDLMADFLDALGEPPEKKNELKTVSANHSLSHEAAIILSEINDAIPVHKGGYANEQRAARIRFIVESIKGTKYICDPALFLKHEKHVLRELQWLHEHIGDRVFKQPNPLPASIPLWSEATTQSIIELVKAMALQIRELSDLGELTEIKVPGNLEWLRGAARPSRQQATIETSPRVHPNYDLNTIRSLGAFIHEMAFEIERLEREKTQTPHRRRSWQQRLLSNRWNMLKMV